MKKVTRSLILVSAVTFLPIAIESTPAGAATPGQATPASAIAPERIGIPKFTCNSLETRFGMTNANKLIIDWKTIEFLPSGYDLQKRCAEVSNRMEGYEKDGTIYNLTQGYINRLPVLCVGEPPQATSCRPGSNEGLVLTLSSQDDASRKLQELKASLLAAKTEYYETIGCKKYDQNVVNNLHSDGTPRKIEVLNNITQGGDRIINVSRINVTEPLNNIIQGGDSRRNKTKEIVVALYQPQAPDRVFATWNYKPKEINLLLKDGKQINITDDWGIQMIYSNGTKSCVYPLKMVSRLDNGKFSTTTSNVWEGTIPPEPPPEPKIFSAEAPSTTIKDEDLGLLTGHQHLKAWMKGKVTVTPDGSIEMHLQTQGDTLPGTDKPAFGASGKGRLIVFDENKKELFRTDDNNYKCGIGEDTPNPRTCDLVGRRLPDDVLKRARSIRLEVVDEGGQNVFEQAGDFLASRTEEIAHKIADDPLSAIDIVTDLAIETTKSPFKIAVEIAGLEDKFGHKTDKWDIREGLAQNGWQVVYMKELDTKEYGKIALATYTGTIGAYFKEYANESYRLLVNGVREKAEKDLSDKFDKLFSIDSLLKLTDKSSIIDLGVGQIALDAGIAKYERNECSPLGCAPMLPSYQPYVRFKLPNPKISGHKAAILDAKLPLVCPPVTKSELASTVIKRGADQYLGVRCW